MIALIREKYNSDLDEDALKFEAEEMDRLMFSDIIQIGHMNTGRWEHIRRTYVSLKMLPAEFSLDGFLYQQKTEKEIWLWKAVTITAASSAILGALVFFMLWAIWKISRERRKCRDVRAMLQVILDTIPCAVYWKDQELRYLGANRVFLEWADLRSVEQLKGLTDENLPWADNAASYREKDQQILETQRPIYQYEDTAPFGKGGKQYYLKSKIPLQESEGRMLGVLGVAENITKFKASEKKRIELIRRVEKAQKHESLKRFTGGVAHHFNNILQSALLNAELMTKALKPGQEEEQFAQACQQEILRAARLNEVLQATNGEGRFSLAEISMQQWLDHYLNSFEDIAGPDRTLKIRRAEGDLSVRADAEGIFQVVKQLLVNAVEATATDGVISLSLNFQLYTASELCEYHAGVDKSMSGGRYSVIEVEDNGSGMDDQVIGRIFDPFYTTRDTGRGLGMAMVLGILISHNGAIRINSSPDGTLIRVLLPCVDTLKA